MSSYLKEEKEQGFKSVRNLTSKLIAERFMDDQLKTK